MGQQISQLIFMDTPYEDSGDFVAAPLSGAPLSQGNQATGVRELEEEVRQDFSPEALEAEIDRRAENAMNDVSGPIARWIYDHAFEIAESLSVADTLWEMYRCNSLRVTIPAAIVSMAVIIPFPGTVEVSSPWAIALGNLVALLCGIDQIEGITPTIYTLAGNLQAAVSKQVYFADKQIRMKDEEPTEPPTPGGVNIYEAAAAGNKLTWCLEGYHQTPPVDYITGEPVPVEEQIASPLVINYMNNTIIPSARECKMYTPDYLSSPERQHLCNNSELMCDMQAAKGFVQSAGDCAKMGENAQNWWINNGYPRGVIHQVERTEKSVGVGLGVAGACLITPTAGDLTGSSTVQSIVDAGRTLSGITPRLKRLAPFPSSIPDIHKARLSCIANNQVNGCGYDPTITVGGGQTDYRRYASAYSELNKTTFLKNVGDDLTYPDPDNPGQTKTLNCVPADDIHEGKLMCVISHDDFPQIPSDMIDELAEMEPSTPDPAQLLDDFEIDIDPDAQCDCVTVHPDDPEMCLGAIHAPPTDVDAAGTEYEDYHSNNPLAFQRSMCQSYSEIEAACKNLPLQHQGHCQWNGTHTINEENRCLENHYVSGDICTPCPEGTVRAAGDNPIEGNTECSAPTQDNSGLCLENHHVSNNACVPCSSDLIRDAGDDPNGQDTECSEPEMVCACPNQYSPDLSSRNTQTLTFKEPLYRCRNKSSNSEQWYTDVKAVHCLKQDENTCQNDLNGDYCEWMPLNNVTSNDRILLNTLSQNPNLKFGAESDDNLHYSGWATESTDHPTCFSPLGLKIDECSQYNNQESCQQRETGCNWIQNPRDGINCKPSGNFQINNPPSTSDYMPSLCGGRTGIRCSNQHIKTPNRCCTTDGDKDHCFPGKSRIWPTVIDQIGDWRLTGWVGGEEPDYQPARCCRGFE